MKCEKVQILIHKDPMQSTPVGVFPHEIAILYEVHGEGSVEIADPFPSEAIYPPEDVTADSEYARLAGKYGVDPERNNLTYVELVYGKPFLGNLEREMSLGKSRIVPDDEQEETPPHQDLNRIEGMRARMKSMGAPFPASAKKGELQQILRHVLIEGIKSKGGKPNTSASLTSLADMYDNMDEAA
jgi:hypothetical protein